MKIRILLCLIVTGLFLGQAVDAKTQKKVVRSVLPKKSYATIISKINYERNIDLDHDGYKEKVSIIERVRTGLVQLWITDKVGIVTMIDLGIPKVDLVIHKVEYEDLLGVGTDQILLTMSYGFHGKANATEKLLTIIALSKDGDRFSHEEILRQKLEFYSKDTISKAEDHQVWKVLIVHTKPPRSVTMKIRDVQLPPEE